MASDSGIEALEVLKGFTFERLLLHSPTTHTVNLLGTVFHKTRFPEPVPAIVIVTKTHFSTDPTRLAELTTVDIEKAEVQLSNDVYNATLGWTKPGTDADVKTVLLAPANEVHIRKYSSQTVKMVRETPELYRDVVIPYIEAFPPSRVNWCSGMAVLYWHIPVRLANSEKHRVYNILEHKTEVERIVFEDPDPKTGFIILPDLKWDGKSPSSLYLMALVHDRTIKSLRDLRPSHLPMLTRIRQASYETARERYGVAAGELRLFLHYQPTYYHLHVHIVHVGQHGLGGITVGQAHLLEEVMDNLAFEVDAPPERATYYERRTFTYGLGENHGLFEALWKATQASETVDGRNSSKEL